MPAALNYVGVLLSLADWAMVKNCLEIRTESTDDAVATLGSLGIVNVERLNEEKAELWRRLRVTQQTLVRKKLWGSSKACSLC